MSSTDMTTPPPPPARGNTPDAAAGSTKERSTSSSHGTTNARNRGQGSSGNTCFRINSFKEEVSNVGTVIEI